MKLTSGLPKGRPKRSFEMKSLRILREVVNDNRFKELCLIAFFGARGYKPTYNADGSFDKFVDDPKASPNSRLDYIAKLFDYKLGKPRQTVVIEGDEPNPSFEEWLASTDNEKFSQIIREAEGLLVNGKNGNGKIEQE